MVKVELYKFVDTLKETLKKKPEKFQDNFSVF